MSDVELARAFEHLRELRPPPWPEDDDLADLIFDLLGTEPFIAGLAATVLAGGTPQAAVDTDLTRHRSRLGRITTTEEDRESFDAATKYLAALEDVVNALAPYRGPN